MPVNQPHKSATLYRMVMPKHTCLYGLKSKDLLERQGFVVDDLHLTTIQPHSGESLRSDAGLLRVQRLADAELREVAGATRLLLRLL